MIHKPPQTGGSIIVSQRLAPYLLGHNPNLQVRLLTFNETHSERFSATMLNIMQSDEYKNIFPNEDCRVSKNAAVNQWSTKYRQSQNDGQHSFIALGLASGIVGSGGRLWIIDDPYKNRDEAFSTTINDKIWWSWKENIIPRLFPEDNVVVMFHRWHEDDFAGRLEKDGGWDKVRIPSICDELPDFAQRKVAVTVDINLEQYNVLSEDKKKEYNESALTPRFPFPELIKMRDGYTNEEGEQISGVGSAIFESLHQGNPRSRDSARVKLEWFNYVKDFQRVKNGFFVRYWDWASSPEANADRTAGCLMYKNPIGRYSQINVAHCRKSSGERNRFMENVMRNDLQTYGKIAKVVFVIEAPNMSVEIVTGIRSYLAERGFPTLKDEKTATKESRAEVLFTQMELGNVEIIIDDDSQSSFYCQPEQRWNKLVRDEMLSFPNPTKKDDLVDCSSGAYHFCHKLFFA